MKAFGIVALCALGAFSVTGGGLDYDRHVNQERVINLRLGPVSA